jgi:hypothetical protein
MYDSYESIMSSTADIINAQFISAIFGSVIHFPNLTGGFICHRLTSIDQSLKRCPGRLLPNADARQIHRSLIGSLASWDPLNRPMLPWVCTGSNTALFRYQAPMGQKRNAILFRTIQIGQNFVPNSHIVSRRARAWGVKEGEPGLHSRNIQRLPA